VEHCARPQAPGEDAPGDRRCFRAGAGAAFNGTFRKRKLAAAAEHHAHVLGCVERLPAKEREVLLLSAFEELTSVEIAAVLEITESSVRSRLFRARNLMAELLDHERSLR
jgi:RNA polymerase sigma factor (sigma-70 family)